MPFEHVEMIFSCDFTCCCKTSRFLTFSSRDVEMPKIDNENKTELGFAQLSGKLNILAGRDFSGRKSEADRVIRS